MFLPMWLLVASTAGLADAETSGKGSFWHITDHHYDPLLTARRSCVQEVKIMGEYGSYWCDSPWKLINSSVQAMKGIAPNVDCIVWTGDDTLHYMNGTNGTLKEVIDIITEISRLIQDVFPSTPVIASIGNHDFVPDNQVPAHPNEVYTNLSNVWTNWIDSEVERDRFRQFGYYSRRLSGTLVAVAMNTNFYYLGNKVHSQDPDPGNQFSWLESILQQAATNGSKVMITGHVPFGVGAFGDYVHMYPEHNRRFVELVTNYSDVIMGNFFGHEHIDSFKLVLKQGEAVGVAYNAPSVTPWTASFVNQPPHNPGMRLFTYQRENNSLSDYTAYYLDLNTANLAPATVSGSELWKKLYSFTEVYGIQDLSPKSVHKVAERIRNGELTASYWSNYYINGSDTKCDDKCRHGLSCALFEVTLPGAKACVQRGNTPPPNPNAGTRLQAGGIILVMLQLAFSKIGYM